MFSPLVGYKTYITAGLAITGALLGALDGDITWSAAFGLVAPAALAACVRHGVSTSTAALMENIATALVKSAGQFAKNPTSEH
jgi:hypothetical protein